MTQQELDKATETINEANTQLRIAMDKLDTQKRIMQTQEEIIELLKATIQNRDKYIAILESQLRVQDNVISKEILKG